MNTPKLYRVEVSYEVLVLADTAQKAKEFTRYGEGIPQDDRKFQAHASLVTTSSLPPSDRKCFPFQAAGTENSYGHTVEWWARKLEEERAREELNRQPLLPGI